MIYRILRYDMKSEIKTALVILIAAVFCSLSWGIADAGVYLDSAHGDGASGVKRQEVPNRFPDYPIGFCAHCHEQHASIVGLEPPPTTGTSPSKFELFYYPNTPSQADNFCFQCHTNAGGYQNGGGITNLTYSYRAGRWVDLVVNDILTMFSYPPSGTSHNLGDISTFITGKWSYTDDSNPCNACHNPHAAQGDPQGNGAGTTVAKTSGTRGWPTSRPSLHSKDNNAWGLWGDDAGEKMSDYATQFISGAYQAPYKSGASFGAPAYEPVGSGPSDGSNLADYVTLCTDCHNASNTTIDSNTLGGNLRTIDWANAKHGGAAAADDYYYVDPPGDGPEDHDIDDIIAPYEETSGKNYVLSCTDCHEPHGSPNSYFIREGVNGGTSKTEVTILSNPDPTKQWKNLCSKCHEGSTLNNKFIHHRAYDQEFLDGDPFLYSINCGYCHEPNPTSHRNCTKCHFHGNTTWPTFGGPLGTYEYGEKLF